MTPALNPLRLTDAQLAPYFQDADEEAGRAQRSHLRRTRWQLILLGLAAISGAFSWTARGADWWGVAGAVAFGSAIFLRIYSEQRRDEEHWYETRAAAESAKTLCWRYAVDGNPFPAPMSPQAAKELLTLRFDEIDATLDYVRVRNSSGTAGEVTSAMSQLRASGLAERMRRYGQDRIGAQLQWYAAKSHWNDRRATLWLQVVLVLEGLGLAGGVLKATGALGVDVLGICSALAAGGGAWLQTKQHRTLSSAYSVTARELRRIATLLDAKTDASGWASFVDQAEEAISREHTLWVASRTGIRPH